MIDIYPISRNLLVFNIRVCVCTTAKFKADPHWQYHATLIHNQTQKNQSNTHVGAVLGESNAERFDNASIDFEESITRHSGLPGHTSRDDNNIRSLQCFSEFLLTLVPKNLQLQKNITKNKNLNLTAPQYGIKEKVETLERASKRVFVCDL